MGGLGSPLALSFGGTPSAESNIVKMLRVLLQPTQDLEDVLQALRTQRSIDAAVGAQLDMIGAIVGQPRNGMTDDDYRIYCRARIATNRSGGSYEDLIKISLLVLNDASVVVNVQTQGVATCVTTAPRVN